MRVSINEHMDYYSRKYLNTHVVFSCSFPFSLLTFLSKCLPSLKGIILFFELTEIFGQVSMNQTLIVVATRSCSLPFDIYIFLDFLCIKL